MAVRPALRWWVAPVLAAALLSGCSASVQPTSHPGPSPTPVMRRAAPGFLAAMVDTADPVTTRYGYTIAGSTPSQLPDVATGQRALVWLGGYNETHCVWNWSDARIRTEIAMNGLPRSAKVAGYFVADEPNTTGNCPAAAGQVKARSALIRGADPDRAHFTLVNIDDPAQFGAFRDSADMLSTDPYPCHVNRSCDWSQIPRYIAQLRAAGVTRYMGMLQAFSAGDWRWPTAPELERMIAQWQQSDWVGELTFSWSYDGKRLRDHPDLLGVLRRLNTGE